MFPFVLHLMGASFVHNHNRKLLSGTGTYDLVKDAVKRVRAAGKHIGAIETTTRFSLDSLKK
jgi:sulfatase maturation enzyme AslB (radical SAM superfamily)